MGGCVRERVRNAKVARQGGRDAMAHLTASRDDSASPEDDAIDSPSSIIRHVERAIGSLSDTHGTMPRGCGQRSGGSREAVGERLWTARWHSVRAEGHELDLVALVR